MFLKMLECIRFLGWQGLALGERNQTVKQFDATPVCGLPWSQQLAKQEDKLVQYASYDIQNEILKLMVLTVLRKVCEKRREKKWYKSIMADKCTNVVNKNSLFCALGAVDESLQEREDFISLYEMATIDSASVPCEITDMLLKMNLPISQRHGQWYDAATDMSGNRIKWHSCTDH